MAPAGLQMHLATTRNNMASTYTRVIVMLAALCVCSCGSQQEVANRKPTFQVTGKVVVDGSPAEDLQVTCHNVDGIDTQNPTSSATDTGKDGAFSISTYAGGDGVPEGDYVLTFFWGKTNV